MIKTHKRESILISATVFMNKSRNFSAPFYKMETVFITLDTPGRITVFGEARITAQ